jgi:hypothetical protein
VRVDTRDAGETADPVDDPADRVPVELSAVISNESPVGADVLEVARRAGGEELDQLRVQRHVAVVTQLAQRDAQPVVGSDLHHRIGLEADQLTDAHPGAGQQPPPQADHADRGWNGRRS